MNNNNKKFNDETLKIGISDDKNRYWVSEDDTDTFFPVKFGEMLYNNNDSFATFNEEQQLIYHWDTVTMSYTRDIGSFSIKIFLKWRRPEDKHWRRIQ